MFKELINKRNKYEIIPYEESKSKEGKSEMELYYEYKHHKLMVIFLS